MSEATSSNYLSIAFDDDKQVERDDEANPDQPVLLDKAAIRKQRIQAAVERSKTEYQSEHAYTERGSSERNEARHLTDKPKIDKQRLEYLASSLYHRKEFVAALQTVLDAIDPSAKQNAGLNRELLDTGIRSALAVQEKDSAVLLARLSESNWRGQSAGLTVAASDAFLASGLLQEALQPLFATSASFGLHEPVLSRIAHVLNLLDKQSPSKHMRDFKLLAEGIKTRRRYNLQQPLFGKPVELDHTHDDTPHVQLDQLLPLFDTPLHTDLAGTLRRLERTSDVDTDQSRDVRSL